MIGLPFAETTIGTPFGAGCQCLLSQSSIEPNLPA
jgi:hypothetical protein